MSALQKTLAVFENKIEEAVDTNGRKMAHL